MEKRFTKLLLNIQMKVLDMRKWVEKQPVELLNKQSGIQSFIFSILPWRLLIYILTIYLGRYLIIIPSSALDKTVKSKRTLQ